MSLLNNLYEQNAINVRTEILIKRNEFGKVAESVTGAISRMFFQELKNASIFYHRGVTAYNIIPKYYHLYGNVENAIKCNCVSIQTASEMAVNVWTLFSIIWGIAITSYATLYKDFIREWLFVYYVIACRVEIIKQNFLKAKSLDPFENQT